MATLKDIIDFATSTGRLVHEVHGDSTAERDGDGHSYGFAAGLSNLVACAGVLIPANHNSPNNDNHGLYAARRKDNGSVSVGVNVGQDISTPGYLTSFKQYGPQVPLQASWQGPQAAYMAQTTLNGAILAGDVTITVPDTSEFPNTGRILIESEIIQYAGKTATTFTGCTRGNLSTVAAGHANGTVVAAMNNGAGWGGMITRLHPLNPSVDLVLGTIYMSLSASVLGGATITQQINTTTSDLNTDTTYTARATSGAVNMTGSAVGSVNMATLSLANAARDTLSVTFGSSSTNGTGPFGPVCLLYNGLFAAARPFGTIQSMGISQGGKRCNEMISELRKYHAGSATVEYDLGYVSRFKAYLLAGGAGVGGNGVLGVAMVTCFGHNEASGGNWTALVDPTEPWTIYLQKTVPGGALIGDTTITLNDTTGMQPAGAVYVNGERITYTGIAGNNLTGCTRGMYGTVAASITAGTGVYVGYPCHHPIGFATDILFDYKLLRSAWLTAGGNAAYFWYVWVRPIPVSATPTYISQFTGVSNNNEKEARLSEFAAAASTYLGSRAGFVIADHSAVWAGGETATYQFGDTTADLVHNSRQAYVRSWTKLLGNATYTLPVRLRNRT